MILFKIYLYGYTIQTKLLKTWLGKGFPVAMLRCILIFVFTYCFYDFNFLIPSLFCKICEESFKKSNSLCSNSTQFIFFQVPNGLMGWRCHRSWPIHLLSLLYFYIIKEVISKRFFTLLFFLFLLKWIVNVHLINLA